MIYIVVIFVILLNFFCVDDASAFLLPTTRTTQIKGIRRKQPHAPSLMMTADESSLTVAIDVTDSVTAAATVENESLTESIAHLLGYVVGFGSLVLYTPIAVRIVRKQNANGLALSTWILKLCSYTCSDVYSFT